MHKTLFRATAFPALVLLGLASSPQAQTWTNLFEDRFWTLELAVLDARHLFVTGVPGTLLKSADGGGTWSELPLSLSVWSVQATHPDTVWMCSGDTLYRSVDGAATWSYRSKSGFVAFGTRFLNGTQGFMTSGNGGLHATLDGGSTWIQRRTGNHNSFSNLDFIDAARGFAIEIDSSGTFPWTYRAIRTTDSGKTWTPLSLPPDVQDSLDYVWQLDFTSPLQGVVRAQLVTGSDLLLSTLDGGASWTRREVPRSADVRLLGFLGETFAYGIANRNQLLNGKPAVSRDGGVTWSTTEAVFPSGVDHVYWIHPDTGWAGGQNFLYRTVDGGATWTRQVETLPGGIVDDVLFLDPLDGWAAVDKRIYRTANGGRLWTPLGGSDTTYWSSLHLADFPGARTLLAVGARWPVGHFFSDMVLGASRDEGRTWTETVLDSLVHVTGLAIGSAQTGYALVDHTAQDSLGLLKTSDRGESWQLLRLPYRAIGRQIQFLGAEDGYIAAALRSVDSVLVLRITQGGEAHAVAARFPAAGFAGMHWEDSQRGWVLSRDTVHRTVDGGATWSKTGLGSWKGSLRAVALDARNVAVYADSGKLLKTSDGFATWSAEKLPVIIRDLQFLPSGEGYALGSSNGQLLRYSPRPVPVAARGRHRPAWNPGGKAGPRFESGAMRFHPDPAGTAGGRAVDAAGRRVGAR